MGRIPSHDISVDNDDTRTIRERSYALRYAATRNERSADNTGAPVRNTRRTDRDVRERDLTSLLDLEDEIRHRKLRAAIGLATGECEGPEELARASHERRIRLTGIFHGRDHGPRCKENRERIADRRLLDVLRIAPYAITFDGDITYLDVLATGAPRAIGTELCPEIHTALFALTDDQRACRNLETVIAIRRRGCSIECCTTEVLPAVIIDRDRLYGWDIGYEIDGNSSHIERFFFDRKFRSANHRSRFAEQNELRTRSRIR